MASDSQNGNQDKREMLLLSNRWVWSIFPGLGLVKQRVLLQVFRSMQPYIREIEKGVTVEQLFRKWPPDQQHMILRLDLRRVSHYNNYWQVRQAVDEMVRQPIYRYTDGKFGHKFTQDHYEQEQLFAWSQPCLERQRDGSMKENKRYLEIGIPRRMAEYLVHVHYGYTKSQNKNSIQNWCKFDTSTLDTFKVERHQSKYLWPLYLICCSWASAGGITLSVQDLRTLLHLVKEDPETREFVDKYQGFDNMRRKILDMVKLQLDNYGQYSFNYSLKRDGRHVTHVQFKVYKNAKYDPNSTWLKLQKAITVELPHFARLTEQEREQFNYLLLPQYNLEKAYSKVKRIEATIQKKKANGGRVPHVFQYILISLHEEFPPPG